MPLWRMFLHVALFAFVAQRAVVGFTLYQEGEYPVVTAGFALQSLAGLAASIAVLLGKRWAIHALVVTALAIALTALYGAFGAGMLTVLAAFSQVLVSGLAAAGLIFLLRHEQLD